MNRCSLLAPLLAGVLLLAACSGAEEPAESADPEETTDQDAEPAEDDTVADPETDEADAEPGTVRFNYTGSAEEIVLWIAHEEGFFAERGIDVELERIAGAGLTPIALQNGEVDLGINTAPDFLLAVDSGLDLRLAAGLSVNLPDNPRLFVIAGADTDIHEPADLEGARIGTPTRGGSFEISTSFLLQEEYGIDADSVTWVEVPFPQMVDALDSGSVDAVATAVTLRGRALAEGHRDVLDLSGFADEVVITFLTGRADWVEANPGVVADVREALQEAADFAEANPERALEIVVDYTGLPPEAAERIPFTNPLVDVTAGHLQTWIDAMNLLDMFTGSPEAEALIAP